MQVSILNGVYTDTASAFRTSYPRNLVPVPHESGISKGYLRPAEGAVSLGKPHAGFCRGGVNWNGVLYRVMGSRFVEIDADGNSIDHGEIAGAGFVTFDRSFDYLSISSGERLYLFNGSELQSVDDVDLGRVIDHIWIDGYFLTTDGEFLVTTELNDPFAVNPLKYGSSEIDPDPVKAIVKLSSEPYVLNRYTIEVFTNTGGAGFPFQRVSGAQVQRGTIGAGSCAVFMDSIVFLGSGQNESIAVWQAVAGRSVKLSTHEIDERLNQYTEAELTQVLVETKTDRGHEWLMLHLPDRTLVYDGAASQVTGQRVWFELTSGIGYNRYRVQQLVYCYDRWNCADTNSGQLGYLSDDIGSHWGAVCDWSFGTQVIYNEGRGLLFHEIELVSVSGRQDVETQITTQYSTDGMTWSVPRPIKIGRPGNRNKRLVWLGGGHMQHWRVQRFTGDSRNRLTFARLEIRMEPLS